MDLPFPPTDNYVTLGITLSMDKDRVDKDIPFAVCKNTGKLLLI